MPEIKAFSAFRFNPERTGPLDSIVTPPYDVISPEERAALASASPYSMAHVLLPEAGPGEDRYTAAGRRLEAWIAEGALTQDEAPGYYLIKQHFEDMHGERYVRRGFFGVTKLPEAGERIILGHERTFAKPIEDRLNLTEATQANLGAIFALYSDPGGALNGFLDQCEHRPPDFAATTIDGVRQEFWRVAPDGAAAAFLADKRLYIADGHHRFQTAITYRDRRRAAAGGSGDGSAPYDYVLMGFVAFEDPGLRIYPPHRVVAETPEFNAENLIAELENWFDMIKVPGDLAKRVDDAVDGCVIGLAIQGKGDYLLRLREAGRDALLGEDHGPAWRDLDVAVLHRGILERLLGMPESAEYRYEKQARAALDAVHAGDAAMCFLLRPTRAEQIRACAEAGEAMPQKSTYFFPKIPSGAVIHRLV